MAGDGGELVIESPWGVVPGSVSQSVLQRRLEARGAPQCQVVLVARRAQCERVVTEVVDRVGAGAHLGEVRVAREDRVVRGREVVRRDVRAVACELLHGRPHRRARGMHGRDGVAGEDDVAHLVARVDDLRGPVLRDVARGPGVPLEVVLAHPARIAATHHHELLHLLGDERLAAEGADRVRRRVEEVVDVLLIAGADDDDAAVGLGGERLSVHLDGGGWRGGRRGRVRCARDGEVIPGGPLSGMSEPIGTFG